MDLDTPCWPAPAPAAPSFGARHPGVAGVLAVSVLLVGVPLSYTAWILGVWAGAAAASEGQPWLLPVLLCLGVSSLALAAAPATVACAWRSRGWWFATGAAALVPSLAAAHLLLRA